MQYTQPPQRKPIRLVGYDYSRNGAYFVTVCTQNRAQLFGKIVGGGVLDAPQMELTECGKTVENTIRSIHATYDTVSIPKYVVMPNHIHMIVVICDMAKEMNGQKKDGTSRTPSPTNATIPRIVSTLKRFVNKKIGFSLFQRSFYDRIIRNEQEYLDIWQYIDENPMKWEEDDLYGATQP